MKIEQWVTFGVSSNDCWIVTLLTIFFFSDNLKFPKKKQNIGVGRNSKMTRYNNMHNVIPLFSSGI